MKSRRSSTSSARRSSAASVGASISSAARKLRRRLSRGKSFPDQGAASSTLNNTTLLCYASTRDGTENYVTQIYPGREPANDYFNNNRTGLPLASNFRVKMVVSDNLLYLSGTLSSGDATTSTLLRRDLLRRNNRWVTLPTARRPVNEGCAVAALKGLLYFVGIMDRSQRRPRPLRTRRFGTIHSDGSLRTPMWDEVATMVRGASYSTVVAWNDYLFRIGGVDSLGDIISHVERYNSRDESDCWTELQPMHTPRKLCASTRVENYIYVLGGKTEGCQFSLFSVEKYDITSNQWTFSTKMRTGRSDFGACEFQGDIVIVGGRDHRPFEGYEHSFRFNNSTQQYEVRPRRLVSQNLVDESLHTVERYDITRDRWTTMDDVTNIDAVEIVGANSVVSI